MKTIEESERQSKKERRIAKATTQHRDYISPISQVSQNISSLPVLLWNFFWNSFFKSIDVNSRCGRYTFKTVNPCKFVTWYSFTSQLCKTPCWDV